MKMTIPRFTDLDQAQAWAGKVYGDLESLNAHLNEEAEGADLCGQYEDALNAWNQSFRSFTMEGRQRRYRVRAHIDLLLDAKDEEAAADLASLIAEKLRSGSGDTWIREEIQDADLANYEGGDYMVDSPEVE